MKRIDTHNHVVPESIIKAMRERPELYNTRIEGERGCYRFSRGKIWVRNDPSSILMPCLV